MLWADGTQDVQYVPSISTVSDNVFPDLTTRVCCKNQSDRKETGCAIIIGEKIGCKTQLKAYDPEMRREK